jgi:hypothetical protein
MYPNIVALKCYVPHAPMAIKCNMAWYSAPPTPWTAIVATMWWQLDRAPAEHAQTESVPSARVWTGFMLHVPSARVWTGFMLHFIYSDIRTITEQHAGLRPAKLPGLQMALRASRPPPPRPRPNDVDGLYVENSKAKGARGEGRGRLKGKATSCSTAGGAKRACAGSSVWPHCVRGAQQVLQCAAQGDGTAYPAAPRSTGNSGDCEDERRRDCAERAQGETEMSMAGTASSPARGAAGAAGAKHRGEKGAHALLARFALRSKPSQ